MAVETNDFRVVGVDMDTGEDVSVVIAAATKAAAEVKAEKLNIDTTHIVRMKRHDDPSADEHTQYAHDAAEARSTTPTDKLIEEIIEPETPREAPEMVMVPTPSPLPEPAPAQHAAPSAPAAQQPPVVLAAVSRPAYSAPTLNLGGKRPSATSALLFVLAVLLGIAGGGYYVLVQEPNAANANDLLPPDMLFDESNTAPPPAPVQRPQLNNPNAFGQRATAGPRTTPVAPLQNAPSNNTPATQTPAPPQPAATPEPTPQATPGGSSGVATLHLQSVVVSHEGRFAVINGKLIAQGDQIAGCTLLNIADGRALLEKDGEEFVLEIETNDAGE